MYSREADVSKDISVWTTVLWLTYKRQLGKRAKRKYQPNDCLADPRQQPPFSCRQAHVNLLQHWRYPWDRHPNLLELGESKIMVDSQLEGEGSQRVEVEGSGMGSREGPSEPAPLAQTTPSPAFIKESIDALRTMIKEHDQQAKAKATPKKLVYNDSEEECSDSSETKGLLEQFSNGSSKTSITPERDRCLEKSQRSLSRSWTSGRTKYRTRRFEYKGTSSDSDHEEDSEDTCEDLSTPYKRPKPTPFTNRITRFKYHRRAKLPRNIKVYEGSKDPEDHLGIFSVTAEQEEWHMLICQKFLEEFSQQKRYAKDPTKIHGIKRRLNEGLQAFIDQFISKSSHIKGVPPVLRITSFIQGHGHSKLAKKLNDKISKMADEMFERERRYWNGLEPSRDQRKEPIQRVGRSIGFVLLLKNISEKQNLNKFCDYHGDRGNNANDCYHMKKQIEEAVASGKLAHLVKDIRRVIRDLEIQHSPQNSLIPIEA
ncbi:hypothetical protein Tco_0783709 [Tanacetum coccineum]